MAYVSLYRKYRPQTFDEILGQEHVAKTLANAITENRVAHAYLFTGPRGTGKTSTARILAKAINCEKGPTPSPCGVCDACVAITEGSSLDVIEMDAASHSKVDETREILAGVPLATAGGRRKVYVIDEVHMLSTAAFNALLKTLEEPPGHVLFVLATTEAHKVLPTIISRTQRFDFRRVPNDVLDDHLAHIAKLENVDIEPDAISVVVRHSEGSVRDALSVLDQLSSFGGHVSVDDVERVLGERTQDAVQAVFDAIGRGDVAAVFQTLHLLISQGADIRQLTVNAIGHARSLLLLKTSPDSLDLLDVAEGDAAELSVQAESFSIGALLRTLDLLANALTEMRNSPDHRLLLEIALVRSAAPETDPSARGLLGRIERLERRMSIESTPAEPTAAPAQQAPAQPASKSPSRPPAPQRPAPQASSPTPRPQQAPAQEAPAEPQPEESSAPAPAVPAQIGLAHIREAWPATLKEVNGRSKRVWGLLSPSQPVDFDGSSLSVEVQSDFHVGSMKEERNRAILVDSLHAALGVKVPITFVARLREGSRPSPEHEQHTEHPAEATSAESHDPIELVKKGFGAEVVEEKTEGS
jgi:DNA polymerase-3 subunit gamma/tau